MLRDTDAAILLQWCHEIMDRRDWSADRWAKEAGIAPTTLTRFLNGQTQYVPSWRTIAKLARAADAEAPTFRRDKAPAGFKRLPLYYPDDIHTNLCLSTRPGSGRETMTLDLDDTLAFAAVVTLDSYDAQGVHAGDVVYCSDTSDDGDTVLAKVHRQFGVYRRSGDWLLPASTKGHEPVPCTNAQVLGRVEKLERRVT